MKKGLTHLLFGLQRGYFAITFATENALGRRPVVGRATNVILGALVLAGAVGAAAPVVNWATLEKDRWAPADYGYGPGKPAGVRPFAGLGYVPAIPAGASPQSRAKPAGAAPAAAVDVSGGTFGNAFPWPIIPIHLALLPDGRVLSYGTDQLGNQGGQNIYDIWSPTLGTGTNAHLTLPNNTNADTFCSAVTVLGNGNALIVGGDVTVNGVRNYSSNTVELFNPKTNDLTSAGHMAYPRWYPSITTLPNGDKLVLGGRLTLNQDKGPPTPELYSTTYGWRSLTGISIDPSDWYYPRGFVGPDGAVYYFHSNGKIFRLTTDSAGSMADTGARMDASDATQPSIWTMDKNGNPFVALMARWGGGAGEVQAVDFSKNPPVVSRVGDMHYLRTTGSFTLLPNGQVLASGGSLNWNDLATAVYQSELYDPYTQKWYLAASTSIPRLYHSNALLLPDGTVLTTGGGAPGPVNELNGQIYYPPYLYRQDGTGLPATRPTIISAPQTLTLNQTFQLTVGANDKVGAVNLVRIGAATHDYNPEQRLIPLKFTQNGTQITASWLYPSPSLVPPGYYMLFVLNTAGVPAVANIVSIGSYLPDLKPASLTYDNATGLFHAVVTNQGTAPTPAGAFIGLSFYLDNGNWVSWGSIPNTLAPGQSVNVDSSQAGPYAIPPGTHSIGVYVDDYDRVAELDKNNNGLWQSVTIPAGNLPDLAPTWLFYDKTTGLFAVGVSNKGKAATPSGIVVGGAFYVDTWNYWVTWGAAPGPLAAGAATYFNSSGGGAYYIPPGTHWIGAWVDNTNRIAESNKNNNFIWTTITVPQSTNLPDLVPTWLVYDKSSGLFTVGVANQGKAATPSGAAIGGAFYVDTWNYWVTWGAAPGPLAAGAATYFNSSGGGAFPISSGTHWIGVWIDNDGHITESNKNNNVIWTTITVP